MKKTYKLKYSEGNGYIGDGLGFCTTLFEQMFPHVARKPIVTVKVSDVRMKKKGEFKVTLSPESFNRVDGIIYKEEFIQITNGSMRTISESFSGDVYVIVS